MNEETTLSDIKTMQIELKQECGHNYMNKCHYSFLASGRHNNDTSNVSGSPGHIYYITPYTTKFPDSVGVGTQLSDAMEQSVFRCEVAKAQDVNEATRRTATRLGCSLLRSVTKLTEVAGTTACHWLIRGDPLYCSHDFATLSVSNAINDQLGHPITALLVPSKSNPTTNESTDDIMHQLFDSVESDSDDDDMADFIEETAPVSLNELLAQVDDNERNEDSSGYASSAEYSSGTDDETSKSTVEAVYKSILETPDKFYTRKYLTKWIGTEEETWEPRDSFVSKHDGTINSSLTQYELNRTLEEHHYALEGTLSMDYEYAPSTPHVVVTQANGWKTITTKNNDTLKSIANLFPNDPTITAETLLESNVWYHSAEYGEYDKFLVGTPDDQQALTTSRKLKRDTVLRLPKVVKNYTASFEPPHADAAYTVETPFHVDYRHRDMSPQAAPRDIRKKIKDLSLYESVSSYQRKKGEPTDKAIASGSAIPFTKEHPLHKSHYWIKYRIPKVPLLWGPRIPNFKMVRKV